MAQARSKSCIHRPRTHRGSPRTAYNTAARTYNVLSTHSNVDFCQLYNYILTGGDKKLKHMKAQPQLSNYDLIS